MVDGIIAVAFLAFLFFASKSKVKIKDDAIKDMEKRAYAEYSDN